MTARRNSDPDHENHAKERAAPMERHLQTVIGAVLIGLVFWVGSTLTTTQTQMAVLQSKLTSLAEEVAKMRHKVEEGVDDRYRASDARRDFNEVWDAIKDIQSDHYRIIPPQP
jgi:hypothetical protein